jgi:hypothetical protein
VWVLLQGQHVQRKVLLKSEQRLYVGHDNGSGSIKYYSAETRKILTSRNYHFLNIPPPQPPEVIGVAPPIEPLEGELRDNMQSMTDDKIEEQHNAAEEQGQRNTAQMKRKQEEEESESEPPRKT